MTVYSIISSAGLIALSGIGAAHAQTALVQGTPGSLFPYAMPHEIRMINGVPCRTMYDAQRRARVPVACAGDVSVLQVN
jgi:hypothetical protein